MGAQQSIRCHSKVLRSPTLLGLILPLVAAAEPRISDSYGSSSSPVHFEANQGQAADDIAFMARGMGYSLSLTATGTLHLIHNPKARAEQGGGGVLDLDEAQAPTAPPVVLSMSLVGAAGRPQVSGIEQLPGKVNYFIGHDPARWRTDIPIYAKVRYHEVYPGIDLIYYGHERQLEYDFAIAAGADPGKIMLDFDGVDRLEIDAEGDLVLHAEGRDFRLKRPVVYQEIGGDRQEIAGGYALREANRVAFELADYDASVPLVIDPILSYSTYVGGSGHEVPKAMTVDRDGHAYIVGYTNSTDFPTTTSAFQPARSGTDQFDNDVFVTKLSPDGSALVYSTYLGGTGRDEGWDIAAADDGAVYVTGWTNSNDFPTTPGAFQRISVNINNPLCGDDCKFSDAFATKLDPTGSILAYSTYLGGHDHDGGNSIDVDTVGNAYVAGFSRSINFPTTVGAHELVGSGAFVTKLDFTGSTLIYSTYLSDDSPGSSAHSIMVDTHGNSIVVGWVSTLDDFETTPGAFQPNHGGGGGDSFVMKLNPNGSGVVYSTYLGGREIDRAKGIAADLDGNVYVTGFTYSPDFPTTAGAFQESCATDFNFGEYSEIFVTKLDSTGSTAVYSTCFGSTRYDTLSGRNIAVDIAGNAWVTGYTTHSDFPITSDALQATYGGQSDSFVTKLSPNGNSLLYSTYLGGSGAESGSGIAVDTIGGIYVLGSTLSPDYPTTVDAFQTTHAGRGDAFVMKFID